MYAVEFFITCSPMPTPLPFSTPVRRALADAESALEEIYGDRLKNSLSMAPRPVGTPVPIATWTSWLYLTQVAGYS